MNTPFTLRLLAMGLLAVAPLGLLLSGTAAKATAAKATAAKLGAAKPGRAPKVAPPTFKAPSPDEIRVESVDDYTEDSNQTGMTGLATGGGEWWILRADDTASRFVTYDGYAHMSGMVDIDDAVGVMEPGAFKGMLDYLQWTRLLNRKVPQTNQGGLKVTLKRGGKTKSAILAYGSPVEAAAASTTLTLVKAFTRDVAWKTAAQFKTGTGLAVVYKIEGEEYMDEKERENAQTVPLPIFSVVNAAGKEVTVLRPNTDKERALFLSSPPVYRDTWDSLGGINNKDISSYLTLAPGTYRLVFKELVAVAPTTATPFIWNALGDKPSDWDNTPQGTVTVKPGYFNVVTIRLEKKKKPA